MTKPLVALIFAITLAAQLLVPASMIIKREATLREGKVFKFRTAPVDPYDAFRGRYVALSFAQDRISNPENISYKNGQRVFAILAADEAGFTQMVRIEPRRPRDADYLEVDVLYSVSYETNVMVRIPYDRFYMDEHIAPRAEFAYREFARDTNRTAYAELAVREGFGVVRDLYFDGVPVRQFISAGPSAY